jgi:hypothetical protein
MVAPLVVSLAIGSAGDVSPAVKPALHRLREGDEAFEHRAVLT